MKKLKNVLLSLFALMLVFMPVTLAGCGETPEPPAEASIKIAEGEYYYAGDVGTYQVMWLDKENDMFMCYNVPAVPMVAQDYNIDQLIEYIDGTSVSTGNVMGLYYDVVDEKEVITYYGADNKIVFTPSDDATSFEAVYSTDADGVIMTVTFNLYEMEA